MCLNAKEPRRRPSIGRRAVKGCRRMGTGQVMKVRMPESCEFKGDIRPSRRIIVRELVKGCRGRSHPGRQTNDGRHITRPRPVPGDGMRRALVKGCRAGSPATGEGTKRTEGISHVPARRGPHPMGDGKRVSDPAVPWGGGLDHVWGHAGRGRRRPMRRALVKGCRAGTGRSRCDPRTPSRP